MLVSKKIRTGRKSDQRKNDKRYQMKKVKYQYLKIIRVFYDAQQLPNQRKKTLLVYEKLNKNEYFQNL